MRVDHCKWRRINKWSEIGGPARLATRLRASLRTGNLPEFFEQPDGCQRIDQAAAALIVEHRLLHTAQETGMRDQAFQGDDGMCFNNKIGQAKGVRINGAEEAIVCDNDTEHVLSYAVFGRFGGRAGIAEFTDLAGYRPRPSRIIIHFRSAF